ncbi:MAG: hypothetical protein J6C97_03990, partial [Clostridia bacterium]|nr:hypothetical protein [Clostridia bacterium]
MKKRVCLLFVLLIICFTSACVGAASPISSVNQTASVKSNSSSYKEYVSSSSINTSNNTTAVSSSSDSAIVSSSSNNFTTLDSNLISTNNSTSISSNSSSSKPSSSSSQIVITEQYVAEMALDSIVFNQVAEVGGEINLQKSFNYKDKNATIEYFLEQGNDVCSIVGEKMFFSSPRQDKRIKVKIRATCGFAVKEKEIYLNLPAQNNQVLYETFEIGSINSLSSAYLNGVVNTYRANSSSSLSITDYNNSKALAVNCQMPMTYGAYAGFYINTKPYTTYQVELDLSAIGVNTPDLSNSEFVHFETYLNSNMGVVANRINLYNQNGKWIDSCPKISSASIGSGRYLVYFTTDDVTDGYAYFTIKVRSGVNENLTIYVDNLQIKECRLEVKENFEHVNTKNQEFVGRIHSKTLNASLQSVSYDNSNALLASVASGKQGYLAFKLNVEKNRIYQTKFNCDVLGASGTTYNDGTTEGDSASVFILANSKDLTNSSSRIYFVNNKGTSVNNTTLINLINKDNDYCLRFTATQDGYVYLIIRTNKITENVRLYVDNLSFSDITKELYNHNTMGYLNGLGEPFKSSNVKDFDHEKVAELYGMLNVQSSRMWFGTDIFKNWAWNAPLDTFVIDQNVKQGYDKVLQLLEKEGVKEITAMGLYLPIVDSTTSNMDNHYVPLINTADYQVFLDKVYELWYELAKAFPQITIWEVGNESNADFLKYKEFKHMSYHERSKVTADMTYYANKGIKAANPNAMTITPGFAPVTSYYTQNTNTDGEYEVKLLNGIYSVEIFLKYMYADIVSGNHPYHNGSKYVTAYDNNPDNYFDGLAWHPYDLGTIGYANSNDPDLDHFDVNLWVNANNACYKVMCDYGDADKGVWFTEFGIRTKESHLVYSPVSQGSMYEYYVSFAGGTVYYTPNGKTSSIVKQKIPAGNYYITFYDQENYAQMQKTILTAYYDAMKSQSMSYVHAWHYFRGFGGLKDYSWNGLAGIYCALFSESTEYLNRGYYPNHKAYILQELYDGSGDLMKYSTYASVHNGDKQVGSGLTETFDNGKATDLSGNTVKYKGDIYAYSSNNNGAVSVKDGSLIMESTSNAYLGFKVNGLTQGKTYTITFEITEKTSNTAFCIFTSDVANGSWAAGTRKMPFGDKYEVAIGTLSVNGNKYSYTITADQNYDS